MVHLSSATRVAQARMASGSTMRLLHSSARVQRGVAIGGGASAASVGNAAPSAGSPFAALRRQLDMDKGRSDVPETSGKASGQAVQQQDGRPSGKAASGVQPAQASTSAQAREQAVKHDQQPSPTASSWAILSQRIQKGQAAEAAEAKAKASPPTSNTTRKTGTIEAVPQWSVSDQGLERSFAFTGAVQSRMFLQGASARLLLEPGWAGSVSLQRSLNGNETIHVRLAGSAAAGERSSTHDTTEYDVAIAAKLDELSGDAAKGSSMSAGRRNTAAFGANAKQTASTTASVMGRSRSPSQSYIDEATPVAVQAEQVPGSRASLYDHAKASSPSAGGSRTAAFAANAEQAAETTASVMGQSQSPSQSNVDEVTPVAVHAEQVPGGHANERTSGSGHQGPVGSVLGTGRSRFSSPIEEHVPVPNLHGQSKREFATMMGRTAPGLLGSARTERAGIAHMILSRSDRTTAANAQQRRWMMAVGNDSVHASHEARSEVLQRTQQGVTAQDGHCIDDFVPVAIERRSILQQQI